MKNAEKVNKRFEGRNARWERRKHPIPPISWKFIVTFTLLSMIFFMQLFY